MGAPTTSTVSSSFVSTPPPFGLCIEGLVVWFDTVPQPAQFRRFCLGLVRHLASLVPMFGGHGALIWGLLQGPLLLFLEGRFRCCCVKTICLIAGLVSAALKCLIETYQSFHCHPCLQSSFITSSFDFNVGHLLASFQPSSGRPSKPCRSSTDFDSSSLPVQSLTVHLILKTPGCFAEVGSFRAMLFRNP